MFKDKIAHDYEVGIDNGNNIRVTQDISTHLEWAKEQRKMSKSKRIDSGLKPYCNVPDSVALDIMTKHRINIHDENIQPEDMRKFKTIIKTEYPYLMYY
jgi:hypothetical protein